VYSYRQYNYYYCCCFTSCCIVLDTDLNAKYTVKTLCTLTY
jgi:hypothetical protein